YGICRDMTEFKVAEQTIEESSKRYRLLFDRNLAGVFRASLSGILLECNDAFAQILGYSSAEEIIGTSVLKFYKEEADRKALITALTEQGFLRNYELLLKKKDGSFVWVLENVSFVEEQGQKILEGALIDITERKTIEEHLKESVNKLQKTTEGIIEAMAKTIEIRDPHTAGHERRVGKLAKAIAEELGLDEEKVQAIYLTGLIHDIGKIYVPAEILTKPGTLTDIEYKLIKVHPEMGYKILEKIDFSWPISKIILQHHERLDGSGYPFGLKNDEICLEARILAVADVVEAMSFHRPYRTSPGLEYALKEIKQNSGKLFDPRVVEATLNLFKKGFQLD
ncbi:MAG: HD domain-containing phosphohydrolase, partial [Thermoanaerobaculia bacterium]